MVEYEKLRNNKKNENNFYSRLNSYFHALENNQLDVYHDQREKRKNDRNKNKINKSNDILECKDTRCRFNNRFGDEDRCRLDYLVRKDVCPYKK